MLGMESDRDGRRIIDTGTVRGSGGSTRLVGVSGLLAGVVMAVKTKWLSPGLEDAVELCR